MGLEEDKYFVIPAYDSPEHTQTRHLSLAAHSAVLVDPSKPAVPVEHVEVRGVRVGLGRVGCIYAWMEC